MSSHSNNKIIPFKATKQTPKKTYYRYFYTALLSLLAAVCIFWIFSHLYVKTYVVKTGTLEKSFSTDALVVKKETVINSPADGKLQMLVKPGERVRVSTPLFMIITDQNQKNALESEIAELESKKKQLEESIKSSLPMNVIYKSIDETTRKLKEAVNKGQFDKVKELKTVLSQLTKQKQNRLELDANNVKALEQSIAQLKKKMSMVELLVNAPQAGIVSLDVDGLEGVLTPERAMNISSSQLEQIKREIKNVEPTTFANVNEPVMKIVDNYSGYLIINIKNNEQLKKGKSYDIEIEAYEKPEKIKAKLIDIHDNGAVGVFSVDKDISELLNFRKINVTVFAETITGNVIPKASIVDSDGKKGVFIIEGGKRIFHEIKVVETDESNAIVEGLKIGDKVLYN